METKSKVAVRYVSVHFNPALLKVRKKLGLILGILNVNPPKFGPDIDMKIEGGNLVIDMGGGYFYLIELNSPDLFFIVPEYYLDVFKDGFTRDRYGFVWLVEEEW